MKRITTTFVFAALLAFSAVAQTEPKHKNTAEQAAQRQTDKMTQALGLDVKEQKAAYAIELEYRKQVWALEDAGKEVDRKKMDSDREAKYKGAISAAHYAKYQELAHKK